MDPRIQYARTSDGVNIAYWSLGEGLPFVHMPWFRMSHVQLEWDIPEIRRWYEALAGRTQLVRYDARGIGLSQRDVSDHSVDALVSDVEAVVDRLGLDRFALFGLVHTGPVAITYAARHPERVSKLILWCTYARSADYSQSSEIQATRDVIDKNWELYTNTLAHVRLGWSEGEPARRFAAVMRESMSPEALHASIEAFRDLDVTELLPKVTCPTLVLHRRKTSWLPVDVSKDLAARLPDARLALLEGESGAPYLGDADGVLATIADFLALDGAPMPAPRLSASGTAIILFADVADSTGITERLGDRKFRDKARDLDAAMRAAIRRNGGTTIEGKLLGDGVLALFPSARQAIEAALACAAEGGSAGLPLHLGLHAGDVIREEGNVYGGAVNIASRICALAETGETLVSDTVRSLARTSAGVRFEDRGEQTLKGISEPVRVWAVVAQQGS
jgi:class 3 adenylate cyclase/pimeloyl-ACP methyl ester carboxylesterase